MTAERLAAKLREVYDNSGWGDKTADVVVFSIRHAAGIRSCGVTAERLCGMAGAPGYGSMVNLGLSLSRRVTVD